MGRGRDVVHSAMARPELRLAANVVGDFFVDSSCIDCDTCRWMAPRTFGRANEQAFVHAQPQPGPEEDRALMALVSCPTSSIGVAERHDVARGVALLPDRIDDGVHHCGFHQEASFGAASYLLVRSDGNVLVDVPRPAEPLLKAIEKLGGVRWLFLTHRDDVAGHAVIHARFGCDRVIHEADADASLSSAEILVTGTSPVALAPGLTVIPTPGHTEGSMCLLSDDRFLFTGDHLAYSERLGHLYAFRSACWFDWHAQIASMRTLGKSRFEWVLPGHGRRVRIPASQSHEAIARAVTWMETATSAEE